MPKGRYKIMTEYMPKVGKLGLDMMYRTCTVQTNLDFSSEADMVKKLRVSVALQPVATALFANSPFTEGKPNGYLSFRSEIWRDTDNARAGMLAWAFEPGMSFERWVDYALDVPMYFVKHGDEYVDASGQSFRDLMAGKLPAMPGARASISDWANHLSTIFPEVRLKRYLEMRGADSGSLPNLLALPAFWVGILYDDVSLDAAWDLVKGWTASKSGKSSAMTCRNRVSPRRFAAAPCSRLQMTSSSWRAPGSRAGNASMPAVRTRRAISKSWKIAWRAAPRRRRSCSRNFTARGAARSIRSMPKRPIEETRKAFRFAQISLIDVVEPLCLGERRVAGRCVAGGVRLASGLERGVGFFVADLLSVLDVLWRRLVMQLRTERLRKGRAARRARRAGADLLLERGDLRRAWTAIGDAGAGEQCRGSRAEEASRP